MKHGTDTRQFIAAVVASVMLITGCSSNPYVRTPGLVTSLPAPSTASASQFAGDLERGLLDA